MQAILLAVLTAVFLNGLFFAAWYAFGKEILQAVWSSLGLDSVVNQAFAALPPQLTSLWGCIDVATPFALLVTNSLALVVLGLKMRKT